MSNGITFLLVKRRQAKVFDMYGKRDDQMNEKQNATTTTNQQV